MALELRPRTGFLVDINFIGGYDVKVRMQANLSQSTQRTVVHSIVHIINHADEGWN